MKNPLTSPTELINQLKDNIQHVIKVRLPDGKIAYVNGFVEDCYGTAILHICVPEEPKE